ncbi:MAG: hypothetical protein ACM30F_03845, partial [Nitrospirota bacterium]
RIFSLYEIGMAYSLYRYSQGSGVEQLLPFCNFSLLCFAPGSDIISMDLVHSFDNLFMAIKLTSFHSKGAD